MNQNPFDSDKYGKKDCHWKKRQRENINKKRAIQRNGD